MMRIIVPKPKIKNTAPPPRTHTTREEYLLNLVDEILWRAAQGKKFTSDDLVKTVGQNSHQRESLGFALAWALKHEIIKPVGLTPSKRLESKSRKIREFIGTAKLTNALKTKKGKKAKTAATKRKRKG